MGIFGWALPPGCSNSDIERAVSGDGYEQFLADWAGTDDCVAWELAVLELYNGTQTRCPALHGRKAGFFWLWYQELHGED